jgi:tripartite ATP-independent transporter DctP family solute receptor
MLRKLSLMLVMALIVSSGFVFASGAQEAGEGPIVMRLAENQPDNNPVTVAMNIFAELVEEKTNGEIVVEVYANAQLGQEPETIEQAQTGVVEFARVNSVVLAEVAPEIGVFTLPYVFANWDHKYRVLDGEIGQAALDSLEDVGLMAFAYMDAGTRNFYTTEPVRSLADLQGMKIRVQPSEISIRMVELLGAVPTPMNYGEVYSALQTGVIDGAENDYVSYYTSSHYEVAPYYSLDGHLSPPAILLMNKATYDSLSPEHQTAIREAAIEASLQERELMSAFQDESREEVLAAGVEIFEVDVTEFQDAVAPIYDQFPQYAETIRAMRALQ